MQCLHFYLEENLLTQEHYIQTKVDEFIVVGCIKMFELVSSRLIEVKFCSPGGWVVKLILINQCHSVLT